MFLNNTERYEIDLKWVASGSIQTQQDAINNLAKFWNISVNQMGVVGSSKRSTNQLFFYISDTPFNQICDLLRLQYELTKPSNPFSSWILSVTVTPKLPSDVTYSSKQSTCFQTTPANFDPTLVAQSNKSTGGLQPWVYAVIALAVL